MHRRQKISFGFAGVLFVLAFGILLFEGVQKLFLLPHRSELMEPLGIMGEHEMRRIEQTGGASGSLNGTFFLASGSITGSYNEERRLQFYWGRNEREFFSTTLPYSKFRFLIEDTKSRPTVEFIFTDLWLHERIRPYREYEKVNLNEWIKNGSLRLVQVRISSEDLENEIYLPK